MGRTVDVKNFNFPDKDFKTLHSKYTASTLSVGRMCFEVIGNILALWYINNNVFCPTPDAGSALCKIL